MKEISDAALKKLYIEFDGSDCHDWKNALKAIRNCLAAKTLSKAAAELEKDNWGDPVAGAQFFRERVLKVKVTESPCQHCDGTGVNQAERKIK